jgi:hypothetical protein
MREPSPYERLLRLRFLRFRPWQRESLTWGTLVLATLLALTGLVSPWAILLLPVLVAGVIKLHDLATPRLEAAERALTPNPGTTKPPIS